MDLESVYLIVGVIVFSAVILLVIERLFKNKSYEEAIAEQRKQNSALYSDQQRPKPKEKKQKKANKKVKEKKAPKDGGDSVEESETQVSDSNNEQPKHHVEFTEPTVIQEDVLKETTVKRKQKREAVRPILVNRDSSAENIRPDAETLPANHFEELHPMDDFELLNAHLKEEKECVLKEKSKNKQNIEQTDAQPKAKKAAKQQPQPQPEAKKAEEKREVAVEPVVVAETAASVASAPPPVIKDKKKKKSELNAIQQLGDKHGVNVSILMPMVRKADLSREEVQTLIDMLLNKQQDAPAMVDEWSEGKADPVQKLKKQLADKEKQVVELQEALSSNQSKMREVRAEETSKRETLQASLRELNETLNRINAERQGYDNKYQNLSMQFNQIQEEKKKMVEEFKSMQMLLAKTEECQVTNAQLNFKLQEQQEILCQQFQEESDKKEFKIREAMEINNAVAKEAEEIKKTNNKLMMQLQSFEHNKNQELMALCMQKEEESDRQLSQLRSELNATEEEKAQLNALAMKLRAEADEANDSVAALTAQAANFTANIQAVEEQRAQLEAELAVLRQNLEAERKERAKMDGEMKLEVKEGWKELEGEVSRLQAVLEQLAEEKKQMQGGKIQLQEETRKLNAVNGKLEEEKKQVEAKNVTLEQEKVVLQEAMKRLEEEKVVLEEAKKTLDKEKDVLKTEKVVLEKAMKRLEEEKAVLKKEKVVLEEEKIALEEGKSVSMASSKQHEEELAKLTGELEEVRQRCQQLEQSHTVNLDELRREVEKEKNKNNDLRRKNWTVVEALNQAESRNKTSKPNEVESIVKAVREEERESNRKFVERLLPEVGQLSSGLPYERWQESVATAVRRYVERQPDSAKLQTEIETYKKYIDETDSMLSRLQKHIESEEIRWRSELRTKDNLIEDLKTDSKLHRELAEKLRRDAEDSQQDTLDTCRKQTKEIDRLRLELEARSRGETNNVQEAKPPSKAQNHSANGPTPPVASNDQTLSTASSSAASSITEVSVKKNKKKKKKNVGGK